MTSYWQQQLAPLTPHALLDGRIQWHPQAQTDAQQWDADLCLVPLLNRAPLIIEGPDAAKFLQGQLTCHLDEVSQDQSRLGAACSPKGRMYTNFRLSQPEHQCFAMVMHSSIVASTEQTLAKYIPFFRQAKMHNGAEHRLGLGITGNGAEALLQKVVAKPPTEAGQVSCDEGRWAICLEPQRRYELWLTTEQLDSAWQILSQQATLADSDYWDLLDIRAGMGWVQTASVDTFIPQAINFQQVGGISFTKGCYTGQEVVARAEYRGQIKKHMYLLAVDTSAEIEPLSTICNAAGKNVGQVVAASRSTSDCSELLAVVNSAAIDGDDATSLSLAEISTCSLRRLPLPYAITKEETTAN